MEITREIFEMEGCYNYFFNENDKQLSIIFGGNLDLYWILDIRDTKTDEEIRKIMYKEYSDVFLITKENYFIYSLFNDLYEDIKNSKIFEYENSGSVNDFDDEDNLDFSIKIMTSEEIYERNNEYKKREFYKLLFDGEKVEWHSDEEPYELANVLIIRKIEDNIVLEFIRPELKDGKIFIFNMPGRISIRFRNSGSLYDPFNILFMKMYNKLQNYNPEYHQMHIEEINYSKIKILKKESGGIN